MQKRVVAYRDQLIIILVIVAIFHINMLIQYTCLITVFTKLQMYNIN